MVLVIMILLLVLSPFVIFFGGLAVGICVDWLVGRAKYFSLRDMLIGTTVVAIILGLAGMLARR
jgi:hypothetical protein